MTAVSRPVRRGTVVHGTGSAQPVLMTVEEAPAWARPEAGERRGPPATVPGMKD